MSKSTGSTRSLSLKSLVIVCAFGLFCQALAFPASDVTVSPKSLVLNSGTWLTVDATVASGSDVAVSVIVDFNGNGVRDGSDFPLRYNKMREGEAPLTVGSPWPGDEDGANGHLRTRLDFWGGPQVAGHYLVIVSDGSGQASDTFSIDQAAADQSVSGTVRDERGAPIPAVALVSDAKTGNHGWAVWTNAVGGYTVSLPTGAYMVKGLSIGRFTDDNRNSQTTATLASGDHTANLDLIVYDGAHMLSGRVIDVSTSAGVPNILVGAFSQGGDESESTALSDASGNFHLPVVDGSWDVYVSFQASLRGLYQLSEDPIVPIAGADANDVNLPFAPPTTYISGTVTRQTDGAPLANFEMEANSESDAGQGAFTRSDGSYVMLVAPDTWRVNIKDRSLLGGGYLEPPKTYASPTVAAPSPGVDIQLQSLNQALVDTLVSAFEPTHSQQDFMDLNGDGKLDIADIIYLLSH